jgi:hypothetical protein
MPAACARDVHHIPQHDAAQRLSTVFGVEVNPLGIRESATSPAARVSQLSMRTCARGAAPCASAQLPRGRFLGVPPLVHCGSPTSLMIGPAGEVATVACVVRWLAPLRVPVRPTVLGASAHSHARRACAGPLLLVQSRRARYAAWRSSGSFAGSRLVRDPVIRKAAFRFQCPAAVGVRDLQRHMRRAVSVMLAMRTVLPRSLSSRCLSACHSTTQRAPA